MDSDSDEGKDGEGLTASPSSEEVEHQTVVMFCSDRAEDKGDRLEIPGDALVADFVFTAEALCAARVSSDSAFDGVLGRYGVQLLWRQNGNEEWKPTDGALKVATLLEDAELPQMRLEQSTNMHNAFVGFLVTVGLGSLAWTLYGKKSAQDQIAAKKAIQLGVEAAMAKQLDANPNKFQVDAPEKQKGAGGMQEMLGGMDPAQLQQLMAGLGQGGSGRTLAPMLPIAAAAAVVVALSLRRVRRRRVAPGRRGENRSAAPLLEMSRQ